MVYLVYNFMHGFGQYRTPYYVLRVNYLFVELLNDVYTTLEKSRESKHQRLWSQMF